MLTKRSGLGWLPHGVLLLMLVPLIALPAQEKKQIKVSSFAPLKDVEAELDYFIKKIGRDLDDEEEFGEDQHQRINLDASTVAVLSLTLGLHDEESAYHASAKSLVETATELAENADNFAAASESYARLKLALKDKPKGEELDWETPVADIVALMQQVPIVNDKLRRGVNDKRRFERNAKKTAQKAVTLAAIAQVSMMNTDYVGDEEDEKEWKMICADMRDACADVYKALQAKDQVKAKAANARVVESCDACHEKFRD